MIRLVWKSIWHRRVQNLALILTVAVSVSLVFSVMLLQTGVSDGLEIAESRLGADLLVVPENVSVEPGEVFYGGSPQNIYMDAAIGEKIQAVPGINRITEQLFSQTLNADCCDFGDPGRLVGIDSSTDWFVGPWVKNGKRDMEADEIIVGDKIPAKTGQHFFILGKMFRVAGSLAPSGTGMDKSIFMTMDTARSLAENSPQLADLFTASNGAEKLVSAVLIGLDPNADIAQVRARITALGGVQVFSAAETKQRIYGQLNTVTEILWVVSISVALASVLQLFFHLYAQAIERQKLWGLYLALGSSPLQVGTLVVVEAIVLCAGGAVLGLAAGYVLYAWSVEFISSQQAFPFINPAVVKILAFAAIIFVSALLTGTIAAAFPAYRSSQLEPKLVLARGEVD